MNDLTKGKISKVILLFALPIFAGQIIQLLYSITDTWIIGKILGDNALAAVASVSPVSDLIIGFLIGLTNGYAVIAARYYGAKDSAGLNKTFGASLWFGTLTSLCLTVLSITFLPWILKLIRISPDQLESSTAYIRILLFGMTASMLYNVFASILRAVGDTIAALVFLGLSVFVNIILVFTFVGALHMGTAGASLATVIAQFLSAFLCFLYIYKRYPVFRLTKESFQIRIGLANQLFSSGLSMGLMSSLVSLGTLILQSSINTFSPDTIVAHYAARKLTGIFMTPFAVFGMTMASYCSQNYGAGKTDRIRTGIKKSIIFNWIWCALIVAISYTIVPSLIKYITSTREAEVIYTGTLYLRIDTLFYFITAVISIGRNALQGIGDHVTPIISSTIELAGKFLTVLFLTPRLNYMGIIICEPIVWAIMVIPLIIQLKKRLSQKLLQNTLSK